MVCCWKVGLSSSSAMANRSVNVMTSLIVFTPYCFLERANSKGYNFGSVEVIGRKALAELMVNLRYNVPMSSCRFLKSVRESIMAIATVIVHRFLSSSDGRLSPI